jgi:hypothetical protein
MFGMELGTLAVGVAIGVALCAVGVVGKNALAWVKAEIAKIEAQTLTHKAVASAINAAPAAAAAAAAASVVKAATPPAAAV